MHSTHMLLTPIAHRVRHRVHALCLATALGLSHGAALAAACTPPLTTGPLATTGGNSCQLVAESTTIDAVFVFADAGGQSTLSLPGFGDIFTNFVNVPGNTVLDIPTSSGQLLNFTLTGITEPKVFVAGVPAVNGKFHAAYRDFTHFSDLGVPAIGPGNRAFDYMAANGGPTAWTFVAWEDFVGGDYDYNDLVFAFRGVSPAVPEPPAVLALLAGLAALGAFKRRIAA
jgi:hypothetical protein